LLAAPTHQSGNKPDGGEANAPASIQSSVFTIDPTVRFPETVSPGTKLSITGDFAATDRKPAVKIHAVGSDSKSVPSIDPDTIKQVSDTEIDVKLPDKLPPGRYYFTLNYGGLTSEVVPGEVRVSESGVNLDGAHPTTAYSSQNGGFDFDVIGEGFSTTPKDNNIYISGQGLIAKSWADKKSDCDEKRKEQMPCIWYDVQDPDKLHVVGYPKETYQGPLSFAVRVGSVQSSQKKLVLARLSPTELRFWSILIFGVLAYIIYRLVARGMRNYIIDGKSYTPFYSFFIDKETDTYSLSKFQLLLFSAVFIFGYLYVFLCSWLVQWQFVLPDVPANFSAILGMSAGTAVVAAGSTSARGSKGAGGIRPSAADFITTGGQVVPERFQYFVWTLVACFGFVALMLSQDPATIAGFPTIPQGLLYVMGVSAGGYLAGKVTRPPGPVIRNISWDKDNNLLVVQGENLSNQGDYFVDGKKLPIIIDSTKNLIQSIPQDQASDRSFCSELRVTILTDKAGLDLTTGDHIFRIMNKDAQFADMRFTADPCTITSVAMSAQPAADPQTPGGANAKNVIVASAQNSGIKVSGTGFRAGIIARWTAVGANEPVEITAVNVQDDKNLTLTLVPGGAGPATLLLVTPNGFSAVATITIVAS
jgi:hypothetical protein